MLHLQDLTLFQLSSQKSLVSESDRLGLVECFLGLLAPRYLEFHHWNLLIESPKWYAGKNTITTHPSRDSIRTPAKGGLKATFQVSAKIALVSCNGQAEIEYTLWLGWPYALMHGEHKT